MQAFINFKVIKKPMFRKSPARSEGARGLQYLTNKSSAYPPHWPLSDAAALCRFTLDNIRNAPYIAAIVLHYPADTACKRIMNALTTPQWYRL